MLFGTVHPLSIITYLSYLAKMHDFSLFALKLQHRKLKGTRP